MCFILLCVFCCLLETTRAECLQYLYTQRLAPKDGPEFEITTMFDGLIISHCQSPSFRDQSRYDWINQAFTAQEWKNRDRFCEHEYYFNKLLFEQLINQSNGIIQRERSCTADGSGVYMSDRWGVNGEDFLTLDPNTQKWRSESSLANKIQSDWNQKEFVILSLKDFELNRCKPSLMKLRKKKADYLKENLRPDVYVFAKPLNDRNNVYLRCYVSHKYLSGVRVRMTLDGAVLNENVNISSPAPNMDGSVQIRLQTETSLKEPERYCCVVHSDDLHISFSWDGLILAERSVKQNDLPDGFHLYDFKQLWITFIILLSVISVTLIAVLAVKAASLIHNRDYIIRNDNINEDVQFYLNLNLPEEEWRRREEEAYNDFYGPFR